MSFARSIESEWLDTLAPDDPRAMRSRRDLRRVNAIMLQARIMVRLLNTYCAGATPKRIIELGGGDGTLHARRCAQTAVAGCRAHPRRPAGHCCRRRPAPASPRSDGGCASCRGTSSVFSATAARRPISWSANLFLHHFGDADLARLLRGAAALAPLFVACEPRRSAFSLLASRMLFAVGCNDVSRHDAVASVRAGFDGTELSRLWPNEEGWRLHERPAWPFTHCFVASSV